MSDDGAKQSKGSFGLIFSDSKEQRLLCCQGPVFGHAPSLFCSEAFGTLAVVKIVCHIVNHFGRTPLKLNHHLDNKGVITRMNKLMDTMRVIP